MFINKDLSFLQDGDIINHGNFSQDVPVVVNASIQVNGGNWLNVETPNAAGHVTHRKIDYCYWLHGADSDSVKELPLEAENCSHVTDTLIIGGETMYIREDTVVQ